MSRENLSGNSLLNLDIFGDKTSVETSGPVHPDIQRKGRNRFNQIARRALILAAAGVLAFSVLAGNPVRITAQEVPIVNTEQAVNENDDSSNTCTPPNASDREAQEEFIEGPSSCKQEANQLVEPVAVEQVQPPRTARILSCVTSTLTIDELKKQPYSELGNYLTEPVDGFIPMNDMSIQTSGIAYSTEPVGGNSFGYIATYTAEIPAPGQGRIWKNHRPAFSPAVPGRQAKLVDGVMMTFSPINPTTAEIPLNYRVFGRENEDGSSVWPIIYGYALWNDAGDQVLSGKVCYAAGERLPTSVIAPPLGDWNKLAPLGIYR